MCGHLGYGGRMRHFVNDDMSDVFIAVVFQSSGIEKDLRTAWISWVTIEIASWSSCLLLSEFLVDVAFREKVDRSVAASLGSSISKETYYLSGFWRELIEIQTLEDLCAGGLAEGL